MSDQPRLSDQFKNEVESPPSLHHVKTVEKQVLPTQQDIAQEKVPQEAANFDHKKLAHVETDEKNPLPTELDIAQEKVPQEAAEFDHKKLAHVEPVVKHNIEVIEQ